MRKGLKKGKNLSYCMAGKGEKKNKRNIKMGTNTCFGDRTSGAFLIIASVSWTKITRFHGPVTVFNSVTTPRVLSYRCVLHYFLTMPVASN